MLSTILAWLRHLSRICGFDTADSFPPGHPHARTRWKAAYFDIASDLKPEQIERRLCEAIANTPLVFSYISNPTPAMQRALFGVIGERARRGGNTGELLALLIAAYRSPHLLEAAPGLRAAIEGSEYDGAAQQERLVLDFKGRMP
jgi:hypothetical protein